MDTTFYKPLNWTPELVGRFWNHWSDQKDEIYFGRMFGPVVMRLVERNGWLSEPVVDVGCGPGHILEWLGSKGLRCYGVDWSLDSIQAARARCQRFPSFGGVSHAIGDRIELPEGEANTIVLMEVLEHLLDDQVADTLSEIRRVLKPYGRLVVTVPSNEDLRKSQVCCPNCGAQFHKVQHVRSFSAQSIAELIGSAGFRVLHAESYNFGVLGSSYISQLLHLIRSKLRGRTAKQPHLLCVAEKS